MADTTRNIKIVIDSTASSQQVDKLEKNIAELTGKMEALAKAGNKNTAEYKKLETARARDYTSLEKYQAKTQEVERVLKNLSGATYKELLTVRNAIKRQLETQTRGTEKYNATLQEYKRVSIEARKATADMNSELGCQNEMWTWLKGSVASYLGNIFSSITSRITQFISEGVEMARTAEGIERAFNKLDDPELLNSLRQSVRGTVDDVTLMQTAVKASNFKIPVENLATYLKFAQQRAQETGESVDYLVNSIITGIGRKSPMILDNLGISTAQLSEKMKETGDFAQAASAIIEEELAKQGNLADTAADKAQARAAELKNLQLETGKVMKGVYDWFAGTFSKILSGTIRLFTELKNWFVILIPAIVAYTVALKAKGVAQALNNKLTQQKILLNKLEMIQVTLAIAKEYALAAAKALLAGKIKAATAAMRSFLLTLSINPIALAIAAIAAIGVAIYNAAQKTKELSAEQKALNSIQKNTAEQFSKEKAEVENLTRAIENGRLPREARIRAIEKLKEIMPEYNGMLDDEGKLINHNTSQIKDYLKILQKKIELQATEDERTKIATRRNKAQMDIDEADEYLRTPGKGDWDKAMEHVKKKQEALKEIAETDILLKKLDALYEKRANEIDAALAKETGATQSLIEAKKKEIELAQTMPETTKEEIAAKNIRLKQLNDELAALQKLGMEETKKTGKTAEDPEYKREREALENWLEEERTKLKQAYIEKGTYNDMEITSHEIFLSEYEALEGKALAKRLVLMGLEPQEAAKIEAQILDAKVNRLKKEEDEEKRAAEKAEQDREKRKKQEADDEKERTRKAKEQINRREQMETISLMEKYLNGLMSEEEYQKKLGEIQERYLKERMQMEEYTEEEVLQMKKDGLEKQIQDKKDAGNAIIAEIEKYKQHIEKAAQFIRNLEEIETAKIQSEYAKRQGALTEQYNQGILSQEEYSEQKEQLDYEQKVKELEIQKKYADANFVMQIASIGASTAQGIITAWATSMQLGPVAGPIAAGIMTGLLATISIAQIAKAKAERDKVKSMTIESPGGGGGSSTPTGARVLNQAAKGRYDVIGGDDGKLYRDVPYTGTPVTGIVSTPTIVAETGSELIVSAPDLKRLEKHVNYPLIVSAINDARAGTLPQRAAGNYAPLSAADTSAGTSTGRPDESGSDITAALQDIRNFLHDLKSGVNIKAKASVSLTDLKAAQELEAKATKTFTK